jgi:hypothetical protein
MADPTVKASGSAGTQGASADVQGPQKAPAAEAPKTDTVVDPDKETWQIHPFGGIDYTYFDAGQGTDGLFSSGFGKLSDQTWTSFNGGFTTNVNANDVRFEFGPELTFGMLRGGPQTNESKINNLGVGPRLVLDWNRAYGFSHLRLFGRLDAAYNIGYAWGETTANPSIRKYEQDALSHKLRGALELVGWNFDSGEAALNINGGAYIADGEQVNNTGMMLGLGAELRLGSHEKVRKVSQPECREMVSDIEGNRLKLAAALKKAEDLTIEVMSYRRYLENLPKHPYNQANIRKALVLGNVALQMQAKTQLETGKIQEAARAANKAEDMEKATAALVEQTGLPEADVKAMVSDAEKRFPPDYNDFWKLPEGSPIKADSDAMTKPVSGDPCDKDAAKINRELWDALDKTNDLIAALEQQQRRAIHLAGLFLGEDAKEILAATVINVKTPSFISAFPKDPEVALMKSISARGPLTAEVEVDEKGAIKKVKTDPELEKLAKRVFTAPHTELGTIYRLAQWLNGEGQLPGEERIKKVIQEEFKGKVAEPTPAAEAEFKKFVQQLSLGIFGHTDSDGKDDANQALSQRRADFIMYLLVAFGVDAGRIKTKGFGEQFPELPETTGNNLERAIAKGKNRRVEFVPVALAGPITGSREEAQGHVDGSKVSVEEGGTKGKGKADRAAEGGTKPAARPAAKPAAAPQPQPKADTKKEDNPFVTTP